MNEPMRIIYLEAENVKRLKAVRIKPDKTLVRIEGRNAQGKSSVLDAIAAALGGGKWNPEMPIHRGEKKASVKLDLGSLIVERRWTAAGNTFLEVTTPDGVSQKSPQAILDKLVGDLTFDPLDFVRMKPKDQAEILKRLAGLNFDDLERDRERLYAERTFANRQAKEAEARVGTVPSNVPAKPIDVTELVKQNAAAMMNNADMDQSAGLISGLQSQADGVKRQSDGDCQRLRDSIKRMEADLDAAKESIANIGKDAESKIAAIAKAVAAEQARLAGMRHVDVSTFATEIANAETTNRMIRDAEAWKERKADANAKCRAANDLDEKITKLDAEKDRRLTAAKFPLTALSVDANGPTLNGVPFSQASSAEQLRTSVAIGLSGKPQARIMLIRDGSLLDSNGLDEMHKIAEEYDAQVFIERVAEAASPSAVFIEDGEVVE